MKKAKAKAKSRSAGLSYNSILKVVILILLVVLAVYYVRAKIQIAAVQEELAQLEEQIETQKLINKDARLALREDDTYMERAAREKLDYAHPEERVFVDVSGIE